jgi:hypothetical protein
MKGSVESFVNLLIYVLLFVTAIFALVLVANGTPIAQNQCIIAQSGIINDLRMKIREAGERGITIPYSFDVLDCVKCMWYDPGSENLIVMYSVRKSFLSHEEFMRTPYSLSANLVNIGCNCDSCDQNDGSNPPTYCANLRNDKKTPYEFDINETHITCLNCNNIYTPHQCPSTHRICPCPGSLCTILSCGSSINGSLDFVGEEKYYQYSLLSPTNVVITLTTENGNYYNLSAMEQNYCSGTDVWSCTKSMVSPQVCSLNNLQPDSYYIRVSRNKVGKMNYTLSLAC